MTNPENRPTPYEYSTKKENTSSSPDTLLDENLENLSEREQLNNLEVMDGKKDMLWGLLWAVGGTVATIADLGYYFWGAIIFGAIQFFQGLARSQKG